MASDSSEELTVEPNLALKRKTISSKHKAAKRVIKRLRTLQAAREPMLFSLQALQSLEDELETLTRRARRCNETLTDEELDPSLQEADEEAYMAFEECVDEATSLCQEMIVSKTAACLSAEIQDTLRAVNQQMAEHPEKSYAEVHKDMSKLLDEMAESLRSSTLDMDHPLREEVKTHRASLVALRATTAEAKPPIIIRGDEKDQDLPKTTIKKFAGGLAEWHAFWGRFSGAVHLNPAIKEQKKLALLTDLVVDPALHEFMVTVNDGLPGRYQEAVDYLTGRFHRPRELHSIHCAKLATMQPIRGTPTELSAAADAIHAAVSGIRRSGYTTIEQIATSLVAPILPDALRQLWENKTEANEDVPDVDEFITFVRKKATQADKAQKSATVEVSSRQARSLQEPKKEKPHKKNSYRQESKVYLANPQSPEAESQPKKNTARPPKTASTCKVSCGLCTQMHYVFSCKVFLDMLVPQRLVHVQSASLCSNCLRPGHSTTNCSSSFRCRLCKGEHNTLLHSDSATLPVHTASVSGNNLPHRREGLLMTSRVRVTGPTGLSTVVTALLDSGAGMSVVSKRVMKALDLHQSKEWVTLAGIEGPNLSTPRPTAWFTVSSLMTEDWHRTIQAAVLPKVTADLPNHHLQEVKDLPHLKDLTPLADPQFHIPKRVDLLLDVEFLDDVMLPEKITGPKGTPSAWRTTLGWCVMGRYSPEIMSCNRSVVSLLAATEEEVSLDNQMTRFWTQEEMVVCSNLLSTGEKAIQEHYAQTHRYSATEQRYTVTLPRRETTLCLGESKTRAERRFITNELSLSKRGHWEKFQAVVMEYLTLGHAQQITPAERLVKVERCYYMPMHAVFKQASTSTKLRVVFDASSKTSTGASLNDVLAPGPTLHPTLEQILMRFRSYVVALSGDIAKMYREVALSPEDRHFHRFVWRPEKTGPILECCMNRVTFGVTSSPYVAVRTLQQTAEDFSSSSSKSYWHIHNSFYVDDLLAGAEDVASAVQLFQDLRKVLAKGGFDLRKWRSSSTQVLQQIPSELQETVPTQDMVDEHSSSYPKTLGITWNSRMDVMAAQVQLPAQYRSTKRGIVSDTARSFDVLGWLAPFMLRMKILFQEMWKQKVDWDTPLKEESQAQHQAWRDELSVLQDITLPRCYYRSARRLKVELQGFADASTLAYAAVVYVRATYVDGTVSSELVVAKTKVAPLKIVSIPRLELCGAVLLSELLVAVSKALQVPKENWHGWLDSTAALGWLKNCPSIYKTYVANRIACAAEHVDPSIWGHVGTLSNPADCATRGLSAEELKKHHLWWHGPPWLLSNPIPARSQPTAETLARDAAAVQEEKEVVIHRVIARPVGGWEGKFNSYKTLLHATAYAAQFCRIIASYLPGRTRLKSSPLSTKDLAQAEVYLYAQSQARSFGEELSRLSAATPQPVKQESKLKAVNPFLSSTGLMLVGGRLGKANVSPMQANPVILSASDWLTHLIFRYHHEALCHCGPTLLMAHTATFLYVVAARKLAKDVCKDCMVCKRRAPKAMKQMMGQLPAHRVNPALCFQNTGLDYAGPISMKRGNPRKPSIIKGYLAIFICLATRAVHIEVVSDQTTNSLVAALRRFISHKGLPSNIYSDNGSNFVGARSELHDLYLFLQQPSTEAAIRDCLMERRIAWHHIPQRAPHFGGIWEALVKSTKHHLRRTVGKVKLYYEEMSTVTCQIAACLNSRPYLSQDCHDSEGEMPLTPGHFMIGRPMQAYPEAPEDPDLTLTDRWRLCQALVQSFWDQWSKSYLSSLQKRNKWTKPLPNVKVGDLVMMLDETTPLLTTWKMAKVTATYPGVDGLVRAVDVQVSTTTFPPYYYSTQRKLDPKDLKTRKTTYRRPVVKLAPLMTCSSRNTAV